MIYIFIPSIQIHRYEDVNTKDQVARVQAKVDNVREQMQMNICSALEGMDTTENILAKSGRWRECKVDRKRHFGYLALSLYRCHETKEEPSLAAAK